MAAAEADVLAGEQGADDLGRFAQPLMADPGAGQPLPTTCSLQVLASAQAEGEPVFRQHPDRGGTPAGSSEPMAAIVLLKPVMRAVQRARARWSLRQLTRATGGRR